MTNTLENCEGEITINGIHINRLRYADDTTVMAASKEDLVELIQRMKENSKESGLQKKTKIMMVNRQNQNQISIQRIYNIEMVNTIIYRGSLITNSCGWSEKIALTK